MDGSGGGGSSPVLGVVPGTWYLVGSGVATLQFSRKGIVKIDGTKLVYCSLMMAMHPPSWGSLFDGVGKLCW